MSSLTKAAEKREDATLPPVEDRLALTALSQRFHFTPTSALKTPHDPESPKLILLFGWLGARLRHVQKYADGYHQIYPSSPIIIVRSFHSDLRPFSKFATDFHALVGLLQLHNVDLTKSGNGVLLQALSNGGCWSLSALVNKLPSYPVLRPQTVILDSCPGRARYSVFIRAFIDAGNLTLLGKLFYTPIITVIYFLYKFICRVRGRDPFGERRREMLHHLRSDVKVYIYSKKDLLISYSDILSHAKQVKEYYGAQETVICEEFVGSDHVAHLRLDPDRYWKIVQDAWDPSRRIDRVSVDSKPFRARAHSHSHSNGQVKTRNDGTAEEEEAGEVSDSGSSGSSYGGSQTGRDDVLNGEVKAVEESIGVA